MRAVPLYITLYDFSVENKVLGKKDLSVEMRGKTPNIWCILQKALALLSSNRLSSQVAPAINLWRSGLVTYGESCSFKQRLISPSYLSIHVRLQQVEKAAP